MQLIYPWAQLFNLMNRKIYLDNELRKVTPKAVPPIPVDPTKPEAQIELKEEPNEPVQEKSN